MSKNSEDADKTKASAVELEMEHARTLLASDDQATALEIAQKYLRQDLSLHEARTLSVLLRELDQIEPADKIRSTVINVVQENLHKNTEPDYDFVPGVELLLSLEAFEEAIAQLELAQDRAPDDAGIMNMYVSLLIHLDRPKDAQDVTKQYLEKNDGKLNVILHMAAVFSHVGARDFTLELLRKAELLCTDKTQQAKIDYLLAANGESVAGLDQHGMAVSFFDEFADSYDERLAVLENNGPSMVFTVLQELNLPKSNKRRILDAGCGTGLCADFLRQHANHLMGVDISVAMLEKSRSRKIYDLLARTDLSIRATYPDDRYDMVVCADVLVYFGALDTVFANFHDVLTPGGWLLFTVEDESDPAFRSGFKLYPSGRHKHSELYLVETLTRVGFPKPKLIHRGRLRNEMGKPVMGTVVAVQKSALSFG